MRLRFAFISIVIGCLALTGCSNQRIMQELNIVSEEIMVNDKLYKVIRAEDTVTMLYKVDTSFYIRIELFGAV